MQSRRGAVWSHLPVPSAAAHLERTRNHGQTHDTLIELGQLRPYVTPTSQAVRLGGCLCIDRVIWPVRLTGEHGVGVAVHVKVVGQECRLVCLSALH